MTRPSFTASISLGNVLTLIALMAAGFTAFMQVQGQATTNAKDIEALSLSVARHEARLRASELEAARSDERLSSIYSLLSRIDSRLERIEQQERQR